MGACPVPLLPSPLQSLGAAPALQWMFLRTSSQTTAPSGREHTFFPSESRLSVLVGACGSRERKEMLTGEAVPASPLPPPSCAPQASSAAGGCESARGSCAQQTALHTWLPCLMPAFSHLSLAQTLRCGS